MLIIPVRLSSQDSVIPVTQVPFRGSHGISSENPELVFDSTGIDFGVETGAAVVSMAVGRIVSAFFGRELLDRGGSRFGNMITIEHNAIVDGKVETFLATYAHLSKESVREFLRSEGVVLPRGSDRWLAEDEDAGSEQFWIGAGEDIGKTADVGVLTGPNLHVHFSADLDLHFGKDGGYADGSPTSQSRELLDKLGFIGSQTNADGTASADVHLSDLVVDQEFYGTLVGSDGITTGVGDDHIIAGDGDDEIDAGDGMDVVSGGSGNDLVYGGTGRDSIDGGLGNDVIAVSGPGKDNINGGAGTDRAILLRDDLVLAQIIEFGNGVTFELTDGTVVAGFENMTLLTGTGNDVFTLTMNVAPNPGESQSLNASAGFDRAFVNYSFTSTGVTFGEQFGSGSDSISFAGGQYRVDYFSVEQVELWGGSGSDTFNGGHLSSVKFRGNGGADTLVGSDGSDVLLGGTGNDIMTGGNGDDRFVFKSLFGRDTVVGFATGSDSRDRLDLSALHVTRADLKFVSADFGLSTRITVIATGDSILLRGVALRTLDVADDLIF